MMQKDKKLIAFVCTGNTCRSPMAEAIFNNMASNKLPDVEAKSFGIATMTGTPVSQNSVIALKEIGLDISEKTATAVNDVHLDSFARFYCMSQSHSAMLQNFFGVPKERIAVLNVSDPYGGSVEAYRKCRDEIYNSVKEIIKYYEN